MFKVIALLKRKAGTTNEQMRKYYESQHAILGRKQLGNNNSVKYIRRYFNPLPHPITGDVPHCHYDMMMEMWFKDKAQFESTMKRFMAPGVAEEIIEDEAKVFERDEIRMFIVDEEETDVTKAYA